MAQPTSPVSPATSFSKPFKAYAVATAVRVYHKQFSDPDNQWTFCGHKGLLAFGRDRSNLTGGRGSSSIGHGATESDDYWFRVTDGGKTVWQFKIPADFRYGADKPFFHVFSGSSRMFAFRFENDDEAAVFCKKVQDRTCPNVSRKPKFTGIPRPRRVSTSMISSPQPNSFVHLAHVGVNQEGIIETSKDIDPHWAILVKQLSGYGVTQSICEENLDFIEGFLAGAKSVGGELTSPVEQTKAEPQEIKRTLRRKPVMYF